MADSEALLRAVLAEPADDLPRLVFADFLEESGDPVQVARAEFIRLQCELVQLDGDPKNVNPQVLLNLRTRERVLQSKYGESWLDPLRQRGEPLFSPRSHGLFRRGFVEVVWMPAGQFLWKAEKLFERAPIRELRVTLTTLEELVELMDCAYLAKLDALDLSDRKLGDRVAFEAARSPHLRELKSLRLKACGISDLGAGDLSESSLSRHLQMLDVQWNNFTEAGRRTLVQAFGSRVIQEG